ncbi:MAG: hypothetical protein RLZZ546_3004 [Bacteroidota bacterium]|jgi:hypothetical protein
MHIRLSLIQLVLMIYKYFILFIAVLGCNQENTLVSSTKLSIDDKALLNKGFKSGLEIYFRNR